MWSDWKKRAKQDAKISDQLLWDMDLKHFDIQKGRALVAERVAERGDLDDFYAMFALYGGVKEVREIYKNEVKELNPRALAFISAAFNLKKEEMKCYTNRRSKAIHWDY
ncbi:MAG: hypothetical protein LBT05_00360 [Planctomycetaceae bacterium]|nr:hypothetical protein [Planctomycetaceae bacterium]